MTPDPLSLSAVEPLDELKGGYLTAALDGNVAEAMRLLEAACEAHAPDELRLGVIAWAQDEIGRRWAAAEISVADEHLATAVGQSCAAMLRSRSNGSSASDQGVSVVACCVPGELHSFPLRLMCDALSEAGHRVRYLGSTVPEAHLLKMVDDISPEVVALSCSVAINLPSARSTIDALRTLSSPPLIMVGGRAASASLEAMGADIYAHDAREALARLALALP